LETNASTTISNCNFVSNAISVDANSAANFLFKDSVISDSFVFEGTLLLSLLSSFSLKQKNAGAPVIISNTSQAALNNVTFQGGSVNVSNAGPFYAAALLITDTPNANIYACVFSDHTTGQAPTVLLAGMYISGTTLDNVEFSGNVGSRSPSLVIDPQSPGSPKIQVLFF
jgi:hypothetical protein